MRLLFVLSYYHPYIGGAERVVQHLTEGLAARGHTVRVITTRLPGTAPFERINGVEVERVAVPRLGDRSFFALLSVPLIARRVRQYDLVHTASNSLAIPAQIVSRLAGQPVVFTCHEVLGKRWQQIEPRRHKALLLRSIEHLNVSRPYDRHVAVSQATFQDLLRAGVSGARATYIYNGVDELFSERHSPDGKLRALAGAGQRDFLYAYFGRPGATKGVEHLIRAAPAIHSAVPGAILALVLAREPRAQYERLMRLVEQTRPHARIAVVPSAPERAQLARYMLDASCVVVPSLTEGFGLTAAEACALGVPVVATRAGSLPEVVSGRYVLVDPGCAEALAAGVVRAARGHYDACTQRKTFRWQDMVLSYERLYQELIPTCT